MLCRSGTSSRSRPCCTHRGTSTHFVGVTRDITERLRSQQLLRESEQRLTLALHGGNLWLWDWHADSGRLVVNDL